MKDSQPDLFSLLSDDIVDHWRSSSCCESAAVMDLGAGVTSDQLATSHLKVSENSLLKSELLLVYMLGWLIIYVRGSLSVPLLRFIAGLFLKQYREVKFLGEMIAL